MQLVITPKENIGNVLLGTLYGFLIGLSSAVKIGEWLSLTQFGLAVFVICWIYGLTMLGTYIGAKIPDKRLLGGHVE